MVYYFLKDGKNELGPLTINQLKNKSIKKETPVWFAGLEEWTTAEEVHELKELFAINPAVPSRFLKNKFIQVCRNFLDKLIH